MQFIYFIYVQEDCRISQLYQDPQQGYDILKNQVLESGYFVHLLPKLLYKDRVSMNSRCKVLRPLKLFNIFYLISLFHSKKNKKINKGVINFTRRKHKQNLFIHLNFFFVF